METTEASGHSAWLPNGWEVEASEVKNIGGSRVSIIVVG